MACRFFSFALSDAMTGLNTRADSTLYAIKKLMICMKNVILICKVLPWYTYYFGTTNSKMSATSNANMVAVSVIAIPSTIALSTSPPFSGFLPMFSHAFPEINPCPRDGPIPPKPMQIPAAIYAATLTQLISAMYVPSC